MPPQRPNRIADILLKNGVIDELQLRSATAHVERWGGRIAHVLAETGLADEDRIVDTLAQALRVDRIRLGALARHAQAPNIDAKFAAQRAILPVCFKDGGKVLVVAMADPLDLETMDEIQRRSRARVMPNIASEREIKSAIARLYHGLKGIASAAPRDAQAAGIEVAPVPADQPPDGPRDGLVPKPATRSTPLPAAFTDQHLQRLHAVQANQQKSGRIVQAVMALLIEKGYLTPQELGGHFEASWR
jgi:Type II secretion system (T2SS), protein E, N-terminal domain